MMFPLPTRVHLYLSSLFFLLLLFNGSFGERQAASRLELLHADFSKGMVRNGKLLRILEGNVHARQDSLELFCQRAVYLEKENKIILTRDVRLIQGTDTITAAQITYFEDSKIAIAEGNVVVKRPGQRMTSRFIEFHYDSDRILARGDLFIYDGENRVRITADHGEYIPEDSLTFVEKKAHLWRIDSTGTDTLHIFSRRMEYHSDSSRKAIARDSVRIIQGALTASGDSATYLMNEERAYLLGNPFATQENNEIFGKQMELVLKDMELQKIRVTGGARAISRLDSLSEMEDRLEGREIIMFFEERKLREVWAISNARSFYHLKEEGEDRGINAASADTIKAFLMENELDSISVIGGSQGTYYPEDYKGQIVQE